MTSIIESIRAEYLRYKALAEAAIGQLTDAELSAVEPGSGNSVAILCWHLSGNLRSRFTDFLTSDGEKSWRQREEEFRQRSVTRAELLEKWDEGWNVLLATLVTLTDEQLRSTVTIRQQPLLVQEALHRSLAHLAYHVGQIVYVSKSHRGGEWRYLSIPPGGSDAYNRDPASERPALHAARLVGKKTQTCTIERLRPPVSDSDLRGLAELLIDAVESGAAVSFLAPLTVEHAEEWWRRTLSGARSGAVFLTARDAGGIAGTVQLLPAWAPNQPHRAEIAKLLVHSRRRRSGLATQLMGAIEDAARGAGFRLLTLDAKRGAAAEHLYRRLGWTLAGTIPRFALDPDGRTPHDAVIFYRELSQARN